MKMHFTIEFWQETGSECTHAGTARYATVSSPEKVLAHLEKVVREMISARYFDGDNAVYEIRNEMDDSWNPSLVVIATDHADGPVIASGIAYAEVGISI